MSDTLDSADTKKQNRNHSLAGGVVALAGIAGLFAASSAFTGGIAGLAMGTGWIYSEARGTTFKERLPKTPVGIAFAALTTFIGVSIGQGGAEKEAIKTLPVADMEQSVRLGDVACLNVAPGTHAIKLNGVDFQYTCP